MTRGHSDFHQFDDSKAYQEQCGENDVWFDDGREIELLHFIYNHQSIADFRGSPARILEAIDEFGRTKKYLMNVGEDKGKIVTDLIADVRPRVMVELGGYIGYSALLFGDAVRMAGGKRYFSFERNPEFAAVTLSLVDLAGLSDIVKVIVGSSAESIGRLYADGVLDHIDLMFLDHYKPAYVTDLKLCEKLRLVTPGTVLAADNVVKPGNPPYLAYVRSGVQEKRDIYKKESKEDDTFEYASSFPDKYKNQYVKREGIEKFVDVKGNPNLIYESKLIHSFEPTGVPDAIEITKCIGEEK